ncbi:LAFE_0E04896g1_1 [Lachancea fermentati]|uniref:LAFE_0E04896g1_1 n=1 Tax=Lachancea fermentati TaxID=4955 RepID=A0A1G4MCU5_LACFM|nr:LAFE_0E04896g1_1 [Lachancea fermentati]
MSFNSPFFDFFDTVSSEVDNFNRLLNQGRYSTYAPARQVTQGKNDEKAVTKTQKSPDSTVAKRTPFFDLDNWFNDNSLFSLGSSGDLVPPVDILDQDKNYELHITVPGVKSKKDINLEYHQEENQIIVTGEIPSSSTDENKDKVKVQERASGKFRRVITLPEKPGVDIDNMKANYSSGVLTLTIPKLEPSKDDKNAVRKIEISSEESWGDSKL